MPERGVAYKYLLYRLYVSCFPNRGQVLELARHNEAGFICTESRLRHMKPLTLQKQTCGSTALHRSIPKLPGEC